MVSLFGKIQGALTSDLGTFLTQGTDGLDRKRSQALAAIERDRLEKVRDRLISDYDSAMAPTYQPAASFDQSLAGSPDQPEPAPEPDRIQMVRDALMRAQINGYDVNGADKTLENSVPNYQVVNGGDGAYGIVNPATGQVQAGQLPNQYEDLVRKLKQAQIDAALALAGQRQQAGVLSGVKAKAGGFAPKAPPKPRAGAIPPPPPGKWVPM